MENSITNIVNLFKLRIKHLKEQIKKTANAQSRAILLVELQTIENMIMCFENQEFFDLYRKNERSIK